MKRSLLLLVLSAIAFLAPVTAGAQEEIHQADAVTDSAPAAPATESSVGSFSPFSLSYVTRDNVKGMDINLWLLSYDCYWGETNSIIKTNMTHAICLNYPKAYTFGPNKMFMAYPKFGIGYMWSVLEMKGSSKETSGGVCLNLHPQLGIKLFSGFGLKIGYLYQAYKFQFKGKGVISLGVVIGMP